MFLNMANIANIDGILLQAPVYLLVFARCFAMLMTLPLFSMQSTPRIAKVALAGYMAFFVFSSVNFDEYIQYLGVDGVASFYFILLLIGEALIGIIMGFFVTIIFSAFSSAGQFIAFQMGLGAASAYDSLSQVENPLMGQFFNLIAMLVFMQTNWFQRLFLGALQSSFKALTAFGLVYQRENIINFLLRGLTNLFGDALIIALPIMGTLMLITLCTGLLTKAAPQMNLLSEGFPIMILVSYYLIMILIPEMINFFGRSFNSGFAELQNLFTQISGGIK